MKFSVKTLLAATLLIALTVNGCITFSQFTELQLENAKLKARLRIYRSHTVNFDERKLLFSRAIDATSERMRNFKKDCEANEELIQRSHPPSDRSRLAP